MSRQPHHQKRILFLLKEHSYGNYTIVKSGLLNSVKMLAKALMDYHLVKEISVKVVVDGNSIDREVSLFKPDICFIEAIWVTGNKLAEVKRLHPKTTFIVRVHSNIPFLALEGDAIQRLKEYHQIPGVYISFNNQFTNDYMNWVISPIYLPNIYYVVEWVIPYKPQKKDGVHVGCFGSIRPFKNQLLQAVAAINYGYATKQKIYFHINSSRVEQRGETVLKNLRYLFKDTRHELVEHEWMDNTSFLGLVAQMDIGLQVSISESFNIVTANFVGEDIPIVVSQDITWMPSELQVPFDDANAIEHKIEEVINKPKKFIRKQTKALSSYNKSAIGVWDSFLQ